jgi:hypothetical protein
LTLRRANADQEKGLAKEGEKLTTNDNRNAPANAKGKSRFFARSCPD